MALSKRPTTKTTFNEQGSSSARNSSTAPSSKRTVIRNEIKVVTPIKKKDRGDFTRKFWSEFQKQIIYTEAIGMGNSTTFSPVVPPKMEVKVSAKLKALNDFEYSCSLLFGDEPLGTTSDFWVEDCIFLEMISVPANTRPYTNVRSDIPNYILRELKRKYGIEEAETGMINLKNLCGIKK